MAGDGWVWAGAPDLIREAGAAIEAAGLTGFTAFALVTAYGESRGNPHAVSSIGASGMFQVLPSTAELTQSELFDPVTAIASAADLVQRLRPFGWGPLVTYAGIRRGWRMPKYVDDVLWLRTFATLRRLMAAKRGAGVHWWDIYRPVPRIPLRGVEGWRQVIKAGMQ